MNGAHLHLLTNHVSFFALIFGVVALVWSMKRRSSDLRIFATLLFVLAGVFSWIAVETGEMAENVLKSMDGDFQTWIHTHEEAAVWALRSGIWIATLALVTEWAARKKQKWLTPLQWALLVFAIHGCTVFAVTELHGGKIRHTEVRN